MMKKFILSFIIILSFFFIIPVFAEEENRLLFTLEENEDGEERIVYDSNLFEKEYFMKHTDMAPGRVYRDNLIIENGTEDTYSIFLKMVPKNDDDELLKDITIKVYCRDKLTYTGKAIGGEVNEEFDNAVFICAIDSKKEADVRIESILDKNNNSPNSDLSYVNSVFYAQYGDFTPEEPYIPDDDSKPDKEETISDDDSNSDDNSKTKEDIAPVEIIENVKVNPETSRDKYMISIKVVGIISIVIIIVMLMFQSKREDEEKDKKEKIEILDE